jgi:hypothetical protein
MIKSGILLRIPHIRKDVNICQPKSRGCLGVKSGHRFRFPETIPEKPRQDTRG